MVLLDLVLKRRDVVSSMMWASATEVAASGLDRYGPTTRIALGRYLAATGMLLFIQNWGAQGSEDDFDCAKLHETVILT